jgi:hypothetical protein
MNFPRQTEDTEVVPHRKDPQKAWIITVNMGYGHQRAAYPLRDIAYKRVIAANADRMVNLEERKRWLKMQSFYEGVSRICEIPLIGPTLWNWYDRFQRIASFYPFRDLSKPTFGVWYLDLMLKKGFGMSVIENAKKRDIPFVSTFFVPPLAATYAGVQRVFSIVTDVDINRIWVAKEPKKSAITYLVPTYEAKMRLLQYGVPAAKVFVTGFPLPQENLDSIQIDLNYRLGRLDPMRVFLQRYGHTVLNIIGAPIQSVDPITITYAVGGAGAQKDVAMLILKSLAQDIRDGVYRINLIAGTRAEVKDFFEAIVKKLDLEATLGVGIRILYAADIQVYFKEFNVILRKTDILWTKPSELVFCAGLGLPLIMTKPLGAHEETNRDWIRKMGAGYPMEDPRYTREWLRHWIDTGMLAEAAFDAFTKAPRYGTENIKRIIFSDDPAHVELKGV